MPTPSSKPIIKVGCFDADLANALNGLFEQTLIANTTVVQNTNPTSATNMMTATIPANTFNKVGQSLDIWASGTVNLTTTTSAATFAAVLGSVTLASFLTGSFAVGAINLSWNMYVLATVVSVDSAGNVVFEAHGQVSASLTTAAGSITSYNDGNFAVLSSVPGATPLTLAITGFLAAGNAASFINQRQLLVGILN